jgi:hypothetical protein
MTQERLTQERLAANEYDVGNCQSLFGYAERVHQRSHGVCQLCGFEGSPAVDFHLWRQLTVEHVIGVSQGGAKMQIEEAITKRFPSLAPSDRASLANQIDEANTVTACHFCNSATSRHRCEKTMGEIIAQPKGKAQEVLAAVNLDIKRVLKDKQARVSWKLASVRKAFDKRVKAVLRP